MKKTKKLAMPNQTDKTVVRIIPYVAKINALEYELRELHLSDTEIVADLVLRRDSPTIILAKMVMELKHIKTEKQ